MCTYDASMQCIMLILLHALMDNNVTLQALNGVSSIREFSSISNKLLDIIYMYKHIIYYMHKSTTLYDTPKHLLVAADTFACMSSFR